jgi:hypothetical protein
MLIQSIGEDLIAHDIASKVQHEKPNTASRSRSNGAHQARPGPVHRPKRANGKGRGQATTRHV